MSTEEIRKIINLLESINSNRLDEFDLPWGKKARAAKEEERAKQATEQARNQQISAEAHQALNRIKSDSHSRPIWVYFFKTKHDLHGVRDPDISKIKQAAKIGNFGTFFICPEWEQEDVDPDADISGAAAGRLVAMLQMVYYPSSIIMYNGEVQGSPNNSRIFNINHGYSWTVSDPDDQNELTGNKDNASSVEKIVDIVKRWCNWPRSSGGPNNTGNVPFRR